MKRLGRFGGLWAVCGAALLVTGWGLSVQAQTQEGTAAVVRLEGSADYSEGGGTWSELRVGKVLSPGAVIRTADGSEVDLDLKRNGPVVRLMPSTTLGLSRLLFEDTGVEKVVDTQLDLKAGRVTGVVNKMAVSSKYEVKTPTSVVGIRGTEKGTKYDISATGKTTILDGWAMVVFVDSGGRATNYRADASQTFDPTTQAVRSSTEEERSTAKADMPPIPAAPGIMARELYHEPVVSSVSPVAAP